MNQANGHTILVIDDDHDFQELVKFMLNRQGYAAVCVSSPSELGGVQVNGPISAILLDWQLGGVDGTQMIDPLKRKFATSPIIFVTAHSSPEIAAESIKLGAFDFLTKPLDQAKLMVTMAQAVSHNELLCRLEKLELGAGDVGFEGLVGVSPQMQTVYSVIKNVAPTDVSVMICGESGTGKELVASAIHQRSDRSIAPFVPLNMASIPADLAEATLFGHEKGAFTGAEKARMGAVGEAAGGTLFLDEITEMQIDLQSKLLRFLQERVYRPVGAQQDVKSDVRIVSATNRDPLQAVKDNRLREDLYYRLNVIPVQLPPLREREGDIALLASHIMNEYASQYSKSFRTIDKNALEKLEAFAWPGNVRQLMHLIQRTVVLNEGEVLESHMLPEELTVDEPGVEAVEANMQVAPIKKADEAEKSAAVEITPPSASSSLGESNVAEATITQSDEIIPLDQLEKEAIANALRICDGSAYEAASRLGISPATMYRRIKLYKLDVDAD